MDQYRGVVLSGGGARGPYGAGVLAAIRAIDGELNRSLRYFYAGSSIGALNATLAAQGQLKELIQIYKTHGVREILGVRRARFSLVRLAIRRLREPFAYFNNDSMKKLIARHASFNNLALAHAHLLLTTTNFDNASLETHFISSFVKQFIDEDKKHDADQRRLNNYHEINDQPQLVKSLLASTAVPLMLPPIDSPRGRLVDGGVGRNTPLGQAALFARFLNAFKLGKCEDVICVQLNSERVVVSPTEKRDPISILLRILELFDIAITRSDLVAWEQINGSLKRFDQRKSEILALVQGMRGVSDEAASKLIEKIGAMELKSSATPRQMLTLISVRPSTDPVLANTLDFDPVRSVKMIGDGYLDALKAFEVRSEITKSQFTKLANHLSYGLD